MEEADRRGVRRRAPQGARCQTLYRPPIRRDRILVDRDQECFLRQSEALDQMLCGDQAVCLVEARLAPSLLVRAGDDVDREIGELACERTQGGEDLSQVVNTTVTAPG